MTWYFAHGGESSSGVHGEYLVLAGTLAILSVVLFVQKASKPSVSVILMIAAIGLTIGGFAVA